MAIPATQMRPGMIIKHNNDLHLVFSVEHRTPGNLRAFIQAKLRNVRTGAMFEHRFRSGDPIDRVNVDEIAMEYLYQDGDGYHFMNQETYDQITVSKDTIGDQAAFLQENMKVNLSVHESVVVAVALPQRATLEVVETEPTVRGQTASSSYKPAMLSNGVRTMVPPHISPGTRIVVMTADASYVERAKD